MKGIKFFPLIGIALCFSCYAENLQGRITHTDWERWRLDYLQRVENAIWPNYIPITSAYWPVISVKINGLGQVKSASILKPGAYQDLDPAVLKVVESVEPPPLPEKLEEGHLMNCIFGNREYLK